MQRDAMNPDSRESQQCETLRHALQMGSELTPEAAAHLDGCDICVDALLTSTLEAKPRIAVPEGFAARVAAQLPPRKRHAWQAVPRSLGLKAAVGLLLVFAVAVSVADPHWFAYSSRIGMAYTLILLGEVAGIALWLGTRTHA